MNTNTARYHPSSYCPYGFENCTQTTCITPCKKLAEYLKEATR